MPPHRVRPLAAADRRWADRLLTRSWGGLAMAMRGELVDASTLPGLVSWQDRRRTGLLTFRTVCDALEIVTIDAVTPGAGAGSALVEAAAEEARAEGRRYLLVLTTNDNLDALRFYQRREFALAELHPNALPVSRSLKPSIPEVGAYGIPIRDELELRRPV